ncbi:MAG: hypothetical protein KJ607_11510 [Bacteroidetes bacterium]|nr:hypothetical protein [Bacteroidota bacterium]
MLYRLYISLIKSLPERDKRIYLVYLILLVTTLFYYRTFNYGFVNLDDNIYVYNNYEIHNMSWQSIGKLFTYQFYGHYQPLTLLSYMIQYQLCGNTAGPYHIVNVVFHLITVLLAFRFVFLISGRLTVSLAVALLMGIHPVNTEPVAWISGRNNLLFGLFYLAALVAYMNYRQRKKIHNYIVVLCLFIASVLSKSAAVTLPVTLIIIDYYLDRRISLKGIAEKIPLLLISGALGILAILSAKEFGSAPETDVFSATNRIFLVLSATSFYIVKAIIPFKLLVYHPYPEVVSELLPYSFYLSGIFIVIAILSVILLKKLRRHLIFGLLLYLVTVSVSLQFVPVGDVFACERYAYIPDIGLFYILGVIMVSIYDFFREKGHLLRHLWLTISVFFILYLAINGFIRINVWKDTITLFEDVIDKLPGHYYGYHSVGTGFLESGEPGKAVVYFDKALKIKKNPYSYRGRGLCKSMTGNTGSAMNDFDKALLLSPGYADAYSDRALLKIALRDYSGAVNDFDKAIAIKQNYGKLYYLRANARQFISDDAEVCEDLKKAYSLGYYEAKAPMQGFCR